LKEPNRLRRKKIPKKFKNLLDKPPQVCYNKSTKGQGRPGGRSQNPLPHFRKKIKKALDKLLKMCYNKNVKRETSYRIK
jgi:hypothetical protein